MQWRRDLFSELDLVHQEMERLLEDFSRRKPPTFQFGFRSWEPAVDVGETDTEIVVVAELAGVKEEQLELIVKPTSLYIRGEREQANPGQKRSCHRLEIYWGPFERLVPLPATVDPEAGRATFQDGMLKVVLPKVESRWVRVKTR